jgi:DNA-binding transcriptional LysR family regulator
MEFLHLETFANLVQYQNFSQVAKKMNISQPTVTVRIKTLEEELGIALIIRVGRKVKITPAGQIFYDFVERSLRVLRDGLETIQEENESEKYFTIGGSHTASFYFLSDMIPEFYNKFEMQLSINTGHTVEVFQMVLDQIADVGVVSTNLEHPDLIKLKLYQDVFHVVAPATHPLAQQEHITILDLKAEPIITYERGGSLNFRIESLFREVGIQSNTIMELKYVNSIKKMVREGIGIAFLPWISIEKEVKNGLITILPLAHSKPLTRDIHLVVHKKNVESKEIQTFAEILNGYLDKRNLTRISLN